MIDEEWPKALAAAGFSADQVSLWKTEKTPPELFDVAAQCFKPYEDPERPYAFSEEQYEEVIAKEISDRHKIAMHLDFAYPEGQARSALQAIVGATLRHELEHAQQTEDCGPDLYNVHAMFIRPAMGQVFGGQLPNAYLQVEPVELDANAAAAQYLRKYHPHEVNAIAASERHCHLARSADGPQDRATLMGRMVAFLFLFREAAEGLDDTPVDLLLEPYSSEAARVWRHLSPAVAGVPVVCQRMVCRLDPNTAAMLAAAGQPFVWAYTPQTGMVGASRRAFSVAVSRSPSGV